MKWLTILAVSAAAVQAACTGEQKLDTSDYQMSWTANKYLSGLARTMSKSKVSLTSVINDGNHKVKEPSSWSYGKVKKALQWEETSSFDDMNTKKWVPQGISSTADAYDKGDWNGKKAWVVSWHNDGDTSVRVTFVDQDTNTYRHALLVWPTADDDFGPVQCHAGGIAWYGDTLWVVDTSVGLRVFDLGNVWQVSSGDGVGKSGSKYTAANYKYVIPQTGYYKMSSGPGFRFSYVSLDRTDSPDTLLVGEYQKASSGADTRFAKFQLDYEKRALAKSEASMAYCIGTYRMQGAVSVDGTYYISQSNADDPGELYTWKEGQSPAKSGNEFFPPSSEDLSYNKNGNLLYGLTEKEGIRYILTYDRP